MQLVRKTKVISQVVDECNQCSAFSCGVNSNQKGLSINNISIWLMIAIGS